MESKEFKNVFEKVAKANNFEKAFGGWFKESIEGGLNYGKEKSMLFF